MILNDEIIADYLENDDSDKYSNHWIFYNIEPDEYLYKKPDVEKRKIVKEIQLEVKRVLNNFEPLNNNIFKSLFPNYKNILNSTKVILVVGCPEVYDAMFMEHDNEEYIVFDLINISKYIEHGYNIDKIMKDLLTHELVHKCINERYQLSKELSYIEKLNYITFNEGIAHLLSYKDNIETYDFSLEFYTDKYNNAKEKLKEAFEEKDCEDQVRLLQEADVSEDYWSKYAAISGKIFLGRNIKDISNLYNDGWNNIIGKIIERK